MMKITIQVKNMVKIYNKSKKYRIIIDKHINRK